MRYDNFDFEAACGTSAQLLPSDLPEIAFAGRSNVGKSSLLNRILNRKSLARVSSVPGKTVTVNFFKGDGVRFVDLPGYGFAKVSRSEKERWAELMEAYFKSERNIKLVIQLTDMRRCPTADDHDMIHFLSEVGYPFIVVMTKSDKLNKGEYNNRLEAIKDELAYLENIIAIPFSAVSGEGTDEIKKAIEKYIND